MGEKATLAELERRLAEAQAALSTREAELRDRDAREVQLRAALAALQANASQTKAAPAADLAALRESEARYRAVFESIDEGVVTFDVIFDADGKAIDATYVEANAALGRMTGLTIDIVGKRMSEVLPNLEPFWFDTFGRVIKTGETSRFEYTVHDLENQWFDVVASRVGGEGSARIVLVYSNITARKRAEAVLRESEARNGLLIGSWAQAVWETDAAGVVVTDSPSWRAYTGQTVEEWLGYGWLDAIHPDDRAFAERQWREAIAVRGLVNAEFRLRAPDGGWRWTNVRAVPVLDERGSIEKWAGMNIDIDDRKRAEAALREGELKYRSLFESIDEGFCIVETVRDADGRLTDLIYREANDAYARQAGFRPHIGLRVKEIAPHIEDDWMAFYDRVSSTGVPETKESFNADLNCWFRTQASRVGSNESSLLGIVFEDVTARKRAEIALRESEERQAFLLKLSDKLRPLSDPLAIQDIAARTLGQHLDADRAYYAVVAGNYEIAVVEREYLRGDAPSVIGTHLFATFGSAFDAFRRGRTMAVDDLETADGIRSEDRPGFRALSIRSFVNTPLVKGGRSVAGMTVLKTAPHAWTAQEIGLVEETAERTWAAVERARAEARLRESEERFAQFAKASSDALWIRDAETLAMEFASPAIRTIYGIEPDALLGDVKTWGRLVVPDDRDVALKHLSREGWRKHRS